MINLKKAKRNQLAKNVQGKRSRQRGIEPDTKTSVFRSREKIPTLEQHRTLAAMGRRNECKKASRKTNVD
jgi:hypothetical protein